MAYVLGVYAPDVTDGRFKSFLKQELPSPWTTEPVNSVINDEAWARLTGLALCLDLPLSGPRITPVIRALMHDSQRWHVPLGIISPYFDDTLRQELRVIRPLHSRVAFDTRVNINEMRRNMSVITDWLGRLTTSQAQA